MLKRLTVVALCLALFVLGAATAAPQPRAYLPVVYRVARPGEPTATRIPPTPTVGNHGPPTNTPTPTPTP